MICAGKLCLALFQMPFSKMMENSFGKCQTLSETKGFGALAQAEDH